MNIKNLLLITAVTLGFMACNSDSSTQTENSEALDTAGIALNNLNMEGLAEEIKRRELALTDVTQKVDRLKAQQLMEAYLTFERRFSNTNMAPVYLFKAGELAMSLNNTPASLKHFDKVYQQYKKYEKRPYALFLKAFILENQAKNYDEARITYENFIEEFPNHEMVDDAQYSIKNMGKSAEELIREFEIQDSIRAAQKAS
ncbi:MAG: hypothetical protein CMO34_02410 [Verrucomicrobia bacterium]|nr:hypothetical protein [Verrucomicrobiota bacterium]